MGPAGEVQQMGVERRNAAYLDPLERRVLVWFAARLPAAVTPDRLTALGFVGALAATAAYALASRMPAMLWVASAGLVVNWFGDSLDGTLARWRRSERPRYGFFLDNSVDLIEQALLGLGLALSGYVQWPLVAAVLVTFFMVSMLSLLQAQVSRVFPIAYGGIGLTEIRCGLILWNVALFFAPPRPFAMLDLGLTYSDCLAIAWLVGNVAIFLTTMVRELRRLGIEDPPDPSRAGRQHR
ncbi:MAG TPA: CDP-alcohol phosphatidyltransferase family protein [Stellaceae bacterium]|jgi:phosphatidylglycerophosphate synthase|nr:CDP-alcohol phosphatidyltransferase family protein [Stellaceae bacterium]